MEKEEFDSRFNQGMFEAASQGDSAEDWVIEERNDELMDELKTIEDLPARERQRRFDDIMDDFEVDGYLLSDGRTIRYNQ